MPGAGGRAFPEAATVRASSRRSGAAWAAANRPRHRRLRRRAAHRSGAGARRDLRLRAVRGPAGGVGRDEVRPQPARRLGELLVWIRFAPTRLPARVERYTQVDGIEVAEEIALGGGAGAHLLARGFGPGLVGVRWSW